MVNRQLARLRLEAMRRLVGPVVARTGRLSDEGSTLLRRAGRLAQAARARLPAALAGSTAEPAPPSPFGPPLRLGGELRELLVRYQLEGRVSPGAQPVAWVTSGAPVEVLRACGFHVHYPENHAALCGARQLGGPYLERAEQAGYSRDLCSYARIDLGVTLAGAGPLGALPPPDLLVACTNICHTVLYWFRELARLFQAPLFVVDTPQLQGAPRHHVRRYVRDQLQQLGRLAGGLAGRPLDEDRLAQTTSRAKEAVDQWRSCLELARFHPAPWGAGDMFAFMAPIVMLRGLPEAVTFYRALQQELAERVAARQGRVREERLRLLWDNLPIWHRLRPICRQFAAGGAALVGATYTHAWATAGEQLDPAQPWSSLADAYLQVYLNRDLADRLELTARLCRELGADGVVFHHNRSCKPYSLGQHEIARRLQQEHGLRCLVLEADHADPRLTSAEGLAGTIDAFLESCER